MCLFILGDYLEELVCYMTILYSLISKFLIYKDKLNIIIIIIIVVVVVVVVVIIIILKGQQCILLLIIWCYLE